VIDEIVKAESAAWVDFMIALLEKQGRLIEGGWPGTVSEARRRLIVCLAAHPQEPSLDCREMGLLVDLLYRQAKELWLLKCPNRRSTSR
jgi:hypothetical protein